MQIGAVVRGFRLGRGLSQGDIEKRTGLLRCYLSRVENGHTVPSLETLTKIADALDVPLARFFTPTPEREAAAPRISDEELRFMTQLRRYSAHLGDSDKKLLLAMARKFAAAAAAPTPA